MADPFPYAFSQQNPAHQPTILLDHKKILGLSFSGSEWMEAPFLVDFLKNTQDFTLLISAHIEKPLETQKASYLFSCHDKGQELDILRLGVNKNLHVALRVVDQILEFKNVHLAPKKNVFALRYSKEQLQAWTNAKASLLPTPVEIPRHEVAVCSLGQEYDVKETSDFFVGSLFSFRTFSRALTDEEIISMSSAMQK